MNAKCTMYLTRQVNQAMRHRPTRCKLSTVSREQLLPESVPWLIANHKLEKAESIVRRVFKTYSASLPASLSVRRRVRKLVHFIHSFIHLFAQ